MPGSRATISAAQFAQQLKQKYPQFLSVPDDELVATFVSKNPRYSADYQGGLLVSVSFDPGTGSTLPDESNISAWATPTSFDAGTSDARGAKPILPAESAAQTVEPTYLGATVVVKAESIPARLMVGRYEVVDELGRGGMGIVYKAFDPGIGRTVALKLMSEQLARDSEFRERFLREARGAGSLQHANIVTVHELGEWQGAPFIAMEFLQGRSLEDILRNEKTMSIEKRLDIVAQVCRGLDYAHARGVVHRDIKPANVMVTNDGIAKVVDFGIARLADQKLTSTGNVLGTVSYMSPEQLQGRAVDGRSDVFAVGVVLYEVLTSVLPFAAEDTGAAITNILYRQPPKLSSFLENYPSELDEVIGKALAKDPDDRFQTTRELADRISLVQQELQRSQTAPTVIRNTPLPSSHPSRPAIPSSENTSSTSTSSSQIQHGVTKSTQFAQEWWKFASGQARRNALTVACVAALYLIAIPLVSVPVAILVAIVLATQIPGVGKWRKSVSMGAHLAVVVLVTAVASFCFTKLAAGVMWYVGISGNRLMAIPVLAVLATIIGANGRLALGWWKAASGKSRAVGAILSAFLIVCFSVVAMNWSSTPKSYFARGGDFEQREKSNQEILSAQKAAYESTPLQIWTDSSWTAKSQFYKSRLMWTNKDNGKQLSWAGAKDYCGKLRLGGYPDWRLPSVDELKGLSEGKRAFDESVAIYHTKKGILLSDPSIWSSATGTGFDFGTEDDIGERALCVRTDNGQPSTQAPQATLLAPNGNTISAPANLSSADQTAQPMTYPSFELIQTLTGDTSVAFSPNGSLIASGDWGGTLRIWDAASGKLERTITGLFNIKFLSFSPDGRWLVAPMVDRKIGLWDVATGTLAHTLAGGGACVAFDATGKWLATTNGGNIVNIWAPSTGKLLKTFDAQADVLSMAFAPGNPMPPYDGTPNSPTVLATGGGDGAVRLWDGGNGKLLLTLTGHRGWVSSLAFTSRSLAASGYEDAELRVWSLPSGDLAHIINSASGIGNVAILGEENWLAYGDTDGRVRFWNINTGTELRSLQAHTQKVNSVAISPDGRWLATASSDKTTKIWKLNQ